MKKTLPVLAVSLAVVLGWIWFGSLSSSAPSSAGGELDPPATTGASPQADVAMDPVVSALPDSSNAEREVVVEAPIKPPPPRSFATYTGPRGFFVEVFDLGTGEPVAGAEVMQIAPFTRHLRAHFDTLGEQPEIPPELIVAGTFYKADETGRAYLPLRGSWVRLFAFDGERMGFKTAKVEEAASKGEPVRIDIAVPRTLSVRVTDRLGAPLVDTPVYTEVPSGERWWTVASVRTDATGYASLFFCNLFRTHPDSPSAGRVAVYNPGGEPSSVAIDRRNPPEDTIELVVDRGVELRVRIVDEFGLPFRLENWPMGLKLEFLDSGKHANAIGSGTEQVFARVPAGARCSLSFQNFVPPRMSVEPAEFVIAPGDESFAEAALTLSYTGTVLTGRLVTKAGQPVADVAVGGTFTVLGAAGARGSGMTGIHTDAEGRFAAELDASTLAIGRLEGASASVRLTEAGGKGRSVQSRDFAGQLDLHRVDLGELVFEQPRRHLAGRVVDETGEPVADADIEVQINGNSLIGIPFSERGDTMLLSGPTVTTDSEGFFEFYRDLVPAKFFVQATKALYVPGVKQACASGDEDLRLVLQRGGAMRGYAGYGFGRGWFVDLELLEPDVPGTKLPSELLDLRWIDMGKNLMWSIERELSDGELFGWAGLPGGLYRAKFRQGLSKQARLVIDDLRVIPGETLEDPRLNPVELESLLPSVTLTLFGPDGQRLGSGLSGTIGLRLPKSIRELDSIDDDRSTVTVAKLPVDLVVDVTGFARVALDGVSGDMDVFLEPAPTFRLRLPVQPPEGWHLLLSTRPVEQLPWQSNGFMGGNMRLSRACKPLPNGDFLAELSGYGQHNLFVLAQRDDGALFQPKFLKVKQVIEVAEGQVGGELLLDVTQAQIDALCKAP